MNEELTTGRVGTIRLPPTVRPELVEELYFSFERRPRGQKTVLRQAQHERIFLGLLLKKTQYNIVIPDLIRKRWFGKANPGRDGRCWGLDSGSSPD